MESHGVEETRTKLGELVERTRVGDERFVITRYGKPAAAIVPMHWFEHMEAAFASRREAS